MESTITHLTPSFELCEEKAAKVMRWVTESEAVSNIPFTVAKAFESGVLQKNTASFLRLLLNEQYPGETVEPEVTPEKLHRLLTDAFINTYLYLLTPHSFIPKYLSFGSDTIHVNVAMLARLSSLSDYPYFSEMMEEWFTASLQNSNPSDRKSDLIKFLSEVDRLIIKYSTVNEISSYFKPLYDFQNTESIDKETLSILFTDKGLRLSSDSERNNYSAEELSALLKKAYDSIELTPPPEDTPQIPEYDSFLKELREIGVVLPPPNVHLPVEENIIPPPLEMFIGAKLRAKCIEKIFHDNENEYHRAIIMLNSIDDYSQAELNLNTLLQIHKVLPDTKVAARLYEVLRLRFRISTPINT